MINMKTKAISKAKVDLPFAAIITASLGYFVDVYDLLLFSIVRVPSLRSLGLDKQQITKKYCNFDGGTC